jgi:transcriptional regulator with XRE-family HTH domain
MDTAIPQWELCDRLRRSLRYAGLTPQDMTDYLDVSRSTVSTWLTGRIQPSTQTLRLWALRTGVHYEWLRDGIYPQVEGGIIAVYCPPGVAA